MTVIKNRSTEMGKKFWDHVEAIAATVPSTPAPQGDKCAHAPEIPLDHDFTISELHGPNQSACACGFGQPNGVTSSEVSRHISRVVYRMVPLAEHEELLARERESRKQAEAALREMVRSAHPSRQEHPTMYRAWRNAEIVLGEFEDDIRPVQACSGACRAGAWKMSDREIQHWRESPKGPYSPLSAKPTGHNWDSYQSNPGSWEPSTIYCTNCKTLKGCEVNPCPATPTVSEPESGEQK